MVRPRFLSLETFTAASTLAGCAGPLIFTPTELCLSRKSPDNCSRADSWFLNGLRYCLSVEKFGPRPPAINLSLF